MGSDASSTLCFGLNFEKGYEFPWEKFSIEDWGFKEKNYQPIYEPYDEKGDYNPGWSQNDPRVKEYYAHRNNWLKENPIPVTEEYCGSYGSSGTILVVPNTSIGSDWNAPTEVDPSDLIINPEHVKSLLEFCKIYNLEPEDPQPKWWLCSFYG